jgi:hypothetical protein
MAEIWRQEYGKHVDHRADPRRVQPHCQTDRAMLRDFLVCLVLGALATALVWQAVRVAGDVMLARPLELPERLVRCKISGARRCCGQQGALLSPNREGSLDHGRRRQYS